MDSKEKRKQYYIDNRDKIIERNKKYYHDNKDERQKYNREYYYDNRQERLKYNNQYWSVNGHKYKGRSKHIIQDNFFHATSLKDFIIYIIP